MPFYVEEMDILRVFCRVCVSGNDMVKCCL